MIVYVFNERLFLTQNLSSKISGMYPIYIDNDIMANIISHNSNWSIQLSPKYSSKEIFFSSLKLEPYQIYTIVSKTTSERFFLIMTPRYSDKIRSYDLFGQLTIGSNINCNIYYPLKFSSQEVLHISLVNSRWVMQTNSPHFFVSGNRVQNNQEIFNGDYIFFYGLKMIFLNTKILIVTPENIIDDANIKLKISDPKPANNLPIQINKTTIHDDLPLYREEDFFYRSPRLNYYIEPATVEIDEPPEPIGNEDMPTILAIGPQITMAGASIISMAGIITSMTSENGNSLMLGLSLGTMSLTIIGTLSWPIIRKKYNKHRNKKKEAKRQKKYTEYLTKKQQLINFIKANQRQTLIENHPDPQQCVNIINNKGKELWQKSTSYGDFLTVRLGIGNVETKLNINEPKEQFTVNDDDSLFLAMKQTVNDAHIIQNAPVAYDLTKYSINVIIGEPDLLKSFMDSLFLQIITFHSYTDLKIIVFTTEPQKWEYLKILPHCWDDQKKTRYFTTSVNELNTISRELEKVFSARIANDEEVQLDDDGERKASDTTYKDFKPYYLFFIDDIASARDVSLINKILHYKRNLGFSIIATSQSVSMLPNEVSDFICISKQNSFIIRGDTNSNRETFVADFNNGIDMYLVAQKLANIPIQVEKGKFELPSSIPFLELYNSGRVEQLNSLTRWSQNNPSLSLSVPIGIDQNNEIFKMDIHEKAYGPHGLIAGTTGSGKSEWIITYILSLAINFSPDELQLVLIDYKGGGLAQSFENQELGIKLPHLAGTVTNLDKSEIFRSIAAIESELKRRQSIFNAAREKLKEGSMDIYKYQQCYRKGLVEEPLSHLLIICDEFAELKQQEPDFMEQLISTSRIGRSLGVHLILATQKPSGVVNDQIWSNSKFKVCLKVQDKSDSNEILKKPDAAFLKQTGTFYLQVGNDDYYNLGQVAWAGAQYYPSDTIEHVIDSSIQYINNIGQTIESFKEYEEPKESQGEQLINIVAYISNLSKQITIKSKPIWLTNVSPRILLSDLVQKYHVTPSPKYTYNTVIGEYDEPRRQEQGPLKIDLAKGNIAIIGKTDSGIEMLLSTIIWSSILEHTPAEIAYYIIDFGAETLKKFAKFPHVGEVAFQDELDKVSGILNLIADEIDRRKDILSDYNGSFEYYNQTEQDKMHLITVIINNYDIFSEMLPRAVDSLGELFRDAPKYGITFIITSNTTNAISQRFLQFFNHLILMQLRDDTQYRGITNCRRGLIPKKVIGRGICKLDANSDDSYCEFQTAMIAPEDKELDIIRTYADHCVDYYKCKVKQLTKIPNDISSQDLAKYIIDLTNTPIGINIYEKNIARYNFLSQKIHFITGENINKYISFLYGLTSILASTPNTKIRIVDMQNIFMKPILDIKLFQDNFDTVIAALEKDTLSRTESQDYAINLIIGAGQYKNILSTGGIEIFQNLFNHIETSKKSIYVLIDNYETIRALRLEPWFNDPSSSNGIWLGNNIDSQSFLNCEPVRNEDQKFNFQGLAFNIENSKYTVIKTIMDDDK